MPENEKPSDKPTAKPTATPTGSPGAKEKKGSMTVSEAGRQFLSQSQAQQAHTLVRAWVNMIEWDEFRRVPTLEFDNSGFGDYPSPPQLVLCC